MLNRHAYSAMAAAPLQPIELAREGKLYGWLDAERPSTITQSGGAVSALVDGITGQSFDQATAGSKPVYNATSFFGRPGITFDGVDDHLRNTAVLPWPRTGAWEAWALVDATLNGTSRRILAYPNSSSGTGLAFRKNSSGNFVFDMGDGVDLISSLESTIPASGRHVIRGVNDGANCWLEVNGIRGAVTACIPSLSGGPRNTIGAGANVTAVSFFAGVISIIVVTRPLSASIANRFRAGLNQRRG